jgi:cation diffusion facilitator family transporter
VASHVESKRTVIAAIIANLGIAAIKFVAAAITGSSAMISEGIHSLVDTGNGGLLFHGMRQAQQPADEVHPFGHGKALYFWTLVVSVSIFGIGGGLSMYEGVSHIRHVAPEVVAFNPVPNYIVLALAACLEGWSFSVAIRGFRKAKGSQGAWQYIRGSKDPSTYTILLEDSAALIGLFLAFLGVFLGHWLQNPYLDGAASVAIGLLLMVVAFILAFETRGLLMGEGVDSESLANIRRFVESEPVVDHAADILTMYMGPYDLLVNIGVYFKKGTTAEQMRQAINSIESKIQATYPLHMRIYIEAESLRMANQ